MTPREFQRGERVEVNVSAGIIPGEDARPDWQMGTVEERMPNGMYRIRLDEPIGGRPAEKEATPDHIRLPDRPDRPPRGA